MALVLTNNQHYSDIAEAIREKSGSDETYRPSEMAEAILALTGSGSEYPVMDVPAEYLEYVQYARENLYSGEFAELVVWDVADWIAVSFLMDNFEITDYDIYSTEVKAIGWFTCGYVKSTGTWTSHDYRNTVSPGGNYAKHIVFASCHIKYGELVLFPVGVSNTDNPNNASYTLTINWDDGSLAYAFDDKELKAQITELAESGDDDVLVGFTRDTSGPSYNELHITHTIYTGFTLYRVSTTPLSAQQLADSCVKCVFDDGAEETIKPTNIIENSSNDSILSYIKWWNLDDYSTNTLFAVFNKDTYVEGEFEEITNVPAGVYVNFDLIDRIHQGTHYCDAEFVNGVITKYVEEDIN